MCIILKSITESPKVAESDIITYKVLEVVEDETTGKESFYSPLSQNSLQYNIGKLYTEHIGRTEDVQDSYDMVRGIEKCKYTKTTTGLYSFKDINAARALLIMLTQNLLRKYKIFRCEVPKGSKYYSSNKEDEIVSDNLVILSQVD